MELFAVNLILIVLAILVKFYADYTFREHLPYITVFFSVAMAKSGKKEKTIFKNF